MAVPACNAKSLEAETGKARIKDLLEPPDEFLGHHGYVRGPCVYSVILIGRYFQCR